jgi:hypothetical protein
MVVSLGARSEASTAEAGEGGLMSQAARAIGDNQPVQATLEIVSAPPAGSGEPREPEQLVLRMLEIVKDRVESIHAGQRSMAEELRAIKTSLPMQRKPLSRRTQAIQIHATLTRRNGLCACCQETPVVDANGRLPGAEFDHAYSRNQARVTQTWLVCGECNQRLINTDFRAAARSAFEAYQAALKPLLGRQLPMDLADDRK